MSIHLAANSFSGIKIGATSVATVFSNNEIVWPIGTLVYSNNFTGATRNLTSDGWVDQSASSWFL